MNNEPSEQTPPPEHFDRQMDDGATIDPAAIEHTTHSLTGENPTPDDLAMKQAPAKIRKPKKRKETKADRLQAAAQAVLEAIEEAQNKAGEAMAAYEEALDGLKGALEAAQDAMENLKSVREDEYQGWYDNMTEGLQQTPTGLKLSELLEVDLDPSWPELPDFEEPDFSEAESAAQSILDADYPLGFGKD